jgi:hypothetical protein
MQFLGDGVDQETLAVRGYYVTISARGHWDGCREKGGRNAGFESRPASVYRNCHHLPSLEVKQLLAVKPPLGIIPPGC